MPEERQDEGDWREQLLAGGDGAISEGVEHRKTPTLPML